MSERGPLYTALVERILSASRAFRALPRLPCAPPPRLGDYEALMRQGTHANAARAREVAAVFVAELRPLTPALRAEALTGRAGHAPLFSDAWAEAAGAAWTDYATLLTVVAQCATPEAALLHLAGTEPDAFWTQVWRWLLMQHAGYRSAHDDEFREWLCAHVIARAHPSSGGAWARFDDERRRCEQHLGLWLDLPALMALLERHQIARAPAKTAEPDPTRRKRGRSAL
jgi:hypothetical protein